MFSWPSATTGEREFQVANQRNARKRKTAARFACDPFSSLLPQSLYTSAEVKQTEKSDAVKKEPIASTRIRINRPAPRAKNILFYKCKYYPQPGVS